MAAQNMPHYVDSILTQEDASTALQDGQVSVGRYTNRENAQSVVHSHPYYEMVLPIGGSMVRYSIGGSIYDLHLGELILFPAGLYHSGMFHITDNISERIVAQINAELWERARLLAGLAKSRWQTELVILDADAVARWDIRGLLERLGRTASMQGSLQTTVQSCEVAELLLLLDHQQRQTSTAPGASSELAARAVAYLQAHYTDPNLTVAQLAKYTYTSREHLSRVFKEYTLESVHGYLTNLRMQHCRNAIAAGLGVLEACTAGGFTNYSSFLKSFRALYGITPTEYRAQLQRSKKL